MAKKVVATLKMTSGKQLAKVIRMHRSEKNGHYAFTEDIVPTDKVEEFLAKR